MGEILSDGGHFTLYNNISHNFIFLKRINMILIKFERK